MNKQWKWAIGIVAFFILAPIALGMTALGIRSHAIHGGASVVVQFLGALRDHNYVAAHALLAPPKQAAVSVTTLQKAQEQIEKKKGRWLFPADPNEVHPNSRLDSIVYFYTVRIKPQEEMYVFVRTVRTSDGWRVSEYEYDSGPA